MKIRKILLSLVLVLVMVFALAACSSANEEGGNEQGGSEEKATFTVVFDVEGERFATKKVKEGDKLTAPETDPVKEGYSFDGWTLNNEVVDFGTLEVKANLTLNAKFTKIDINQNLNVDDTKVAGTVYYLVIGWWEALNEDGTPKGTSTLTAELARLFYSNALLYVKALGATADDIAHISFRNYSSLDVAAMVEAVKADRDVDMLIGVGNNVNSSGNLTLLNGNDGKCDVVMGTGAKTRKVAVLENANEVAVSLFDWIKNTQTGKDAFNKQLKESEVEVYHEAINVTVTVHGDSDEVTVINDRETVITLPTFTVPENKEFIGLAKTVGAEEADLVVGVNAQLTYANIESLIVDNKVDLYPVLRDKPQGDGLLVIYIHASASKTTYITDEEIAKLEADAKKTFGEDHVKFEVIKGANGSGFNQAVLDAIAGDPDNGVAGINVDVVVGGNTISTADPKLAETNSDVGAGHFANESRKVLILSSSINKELAQTFVNYLTTPLTVE